MAEQDGARQVTEKDRLVTRPEGQLPTPLDPLGPEARGYPADPKPTAKAGQADPVANNPDPGDIGHSV